MKEKDYCRYTRSCVCREPSGLLRQSIHAPLLSRPLLLPNVETYSSKTSSPAVAERPRDASCLSVQLALIVKYVERNLLLLATSASDLPLRTIKLCSFLFVVVVYAGCDKQDSLMRGVCAQCAINCTVDRRSCRSHSISHRSDSQIFVENRDFCLPHLHSTPPQLDPRRNIAVMFGTEKLVWCGYTMVKKI